MLEQDFDGLAIRVLAETIGVLIRQAHVVQQLVGLGHIVLGEFLADRFQGQRGVAVVDRVDQLLAVDRQADRLAEADILDNRLPVGIIESLVEAQADESTCMSSS